MTDAEKAAEAHFINLYGSAWVELYDSVERHAFLAGYAARDAEVAELKTLVASYRATNER